LPEFTRNVSVTGKEKNGWTPHCAKEGRKGEKGGGGIEAKLKIIGRIPAHHY